MPIKVQCPNPKCGMSASVAEEHLGGSVRCQGCGNRFTLSPSRNGSAPSPTPKESAPLTVIDRYEVREKLGSGAFGTVYRAYDPRLAREVALKVLHPEALDSRKAVERFQREAQSMARLHHPHIVAVHDAGQSGPHHFIASALIRGRTLASAIPDGGLEPRRAVRLAIQLAEALAYAHKQGVFHRDIKPANVLLDEEDSLYLMDFGLAGRTEASAARMTKVGALMGTPAYMAPEQAQGDLERVGPAADLYSAGAVLFEMLTGRPPFEGPLAAVVYNAIHTPAPPPSQYRPGLDADLEAVCLKALAKQPEERFAGGQEMAAALQGWLQRPESPKKLPEKQPAFRPPPLPAAPRSGKAPGNPSADNIFQAQTVIPAQPPARPVSPRDKIPAAQTQLVEPSSARKAAKTKRSNHDRQRDDDEEKSGMSRGTIIGLLVCVFLVLGAVGGVGGLIYALKQKKAKTEEVVQPIEPIDPVTHPKTVGIDTTIKAPKLKVEIPASLEMTAGETRVFLVKVTRENFPDPVKVTFRGLPSGVLIEPLTFAIGISEANAELRVAKETPAGIFDIVALAESENAAVDAKAFGNLRLRIRAAIAPPPPPPDLKVDWPREIKNSIDMKLVRIPPGTFTMGSPKGENGHKEDEDQDEDQHEVKITKEFWLGIHEVTQKQFKDVMGYNPSYFSKDGAGKKGLTYFHFGKPAGGKDKVKDFDNTSAFPVENVSWDEAEDFCKKLSALPEEKRRGRKYRLPTEAEWEYSCRGGASSKTFHFGNSLSSSQANFDGNYPFGGAATGSYPGRTCKVGNYEKNGFGLFDMHGNVWEWCSDWYAAGYYGKSPKADPPGPAGGSSRVFRGGGWFDVGGYCRSANRHGDAPGGRNGDVGFRVVAVPANK